jgi:hypothetical protein
MPRLKTGLPNPSAESLVRSRIPPAIGIQAREYAQFMPPTCRMRDGRKISAIRRRVDACHGQLLPTRRLMLLARNPPLTGALGAMRNRPDGYAKA